MIVNVASPYLTAANSESFDDDNSFMLWFTGLTDTQSK